MKKLLLSSLVISACIGLSACETTTYTYTDEYYPDYDEDYIYSVGYYGYQPYYWGNGYYAGYGWGDRNWNTYGWRGGRGWYGWSGGQGWHGRR